MRSIKLGTFSPSVLLSVAAATGALVEARLEVTEVPAKTSAHQFEDLFEGRLDAAFTNPDNVLAYRCVPGNPLGRTGDVRILGAVDRGLGLGLFTAPGVAGPARGGRLGVDVPGSGFAFIAFELLARAGLVRDTDYEVVSLGSTPKRARALVEGTVDTTVLNAGNDLVAEAQGARRVASVTEIGPYAGTVLCATADGIATHADALAALLTVTSAVARQLATGRHREIALTAVTERLGLMGPSAERHLAILTDPAIGLVPDARLKHAELDTVVYLRNRHSRAATPVTAEEALRSGLVDSSLLPEA
ncbi:ABC transporter substrate-binding protein [Amycolatopsis sp. CA-161197]|uniref:ABC transporter substrate-binding protein n=1 Tax=Amycolatopsis sp. CA-161197 TaxID=3239922 RepID=UPI003D93D7A3